VKIDPYPKFAKNISDQAYQVPPEGIRVVIPFPDILDYNPETVSIEATGLEMTNNGTHLVIYIDEKMIGIH
jgi:hypothetical protein